MASYASTVGTDVAKAGWLYRRSTFLHRWKKTWFVLDRQGDLRYFESPDSPKAEERIVIRAHVTQIKVGPDARKSDAPDGVNIAMCGFLELVMRDKDNLVLCADTYDDIKAWQVAIEEARALPGASMHPPGTIVAGAPYVQYASPYGYGYGVGSYGYRTGLFCSNYPGQVISTAPPPHQVIHTPGTTIVQAPPQVVMVDDDPWRYRNRYGYGYRRHHWW